MTIEDQNLPRQANAGSLSTSEPAFLVVGKLRRPHGVRGEMVFEIYTDFPERLKPGTSVFIGDDYQAFRIRTCRPNGATLLLSFASIITPEQAAAFRNNLVYVRADDRPPLPDGEYYHHQVLGLQVVSDEGQYLGKLVEILESPANDVYVVQPETGPEILIPAIQSVILAVDLTQGLIRVHLLPGLLPD